MALFNVTKNTDNLTGLVASDTFEVAGPTSDLSSSDTIDGVGQGNSLLFDTAGAVTDAQLTHVSNVQRIDLAAKSGSYTLTLGSAATASGISYIDAGSSGANVTLDASQLLNPLGFVASKANNIITGTVGNDTVTIEGATFTASDKIDGGGFGDHDTIVIEGKQLIADSAFTNVHNVEALTLGDYDYGSSDPAAGKVTLGLLSQKAGITEVWDYLGAEGTSLDAGARTQGVVFHGGQGPDIFIGSAGNDTFQGSAGNDSYRVKVANLSAGDDIDGGNGRDEIRILDAGTLLDNALGQVTNVERLAFDGTGKQDVTLGAQAQEAGLVEVDAGKVTGGFALHAGAMTSGLAVTMGSGADTIDLGGKLGVTNDIFVQSAKLTAADHISGVAAANDVLHFTDAVKLTDAYFAGVKSGNVTGVDILGLDNAGKGQTLVAGANFAGFVQHSGLAAILASTDEAATGFTFDFSGYSGTALVIEGSAGSDTFIEGAANSAYVASSAAVAHGGDTVQAASQYFDGQRVLIGNQSFSDTILIADDKNTVVDADFAQISDFDVLKLAAAPTGSYSVTLGNTAKGAGITTVDAALTANAVSVNSTAFNKALTVIAGAGNDTFTDGAAAATFVFAPKSLTAADVVTGGGGIDSLQFSAAGAVAAASFTGVTGIERIVLSAAGNAVVLSNSVATGGETAVSYDGHTVDFLVVGDKGNDTIDLSQVTGSGEFGVIGGAGADKLIAAQGGSTHFFFMNGGDLAATDKITGAVSGGSEVIVGAGIYGPDAFKGMTHITRFTIDDQAHSGLGSTITLDNHAVTQSGNSLDVRLVGTGDDRVDASAVTDLGVSVVIEAGGGNDTLIGSAGGGRFVFDDDGSGGFLLDSNDTVKGGGDQGFLFLRDQSGTGAVLNDGDLAGVTGIAALSLQSAGQVTVNYGAHAAAAGIGWIDGEGLGSLKLAAGATTHALEVLVSTGHDQITLGSGDDIIEINGYAGATLTAADTINGGAGSNTLSLTDGTTLVDADLTHVSNIQQIIVSGDYYSSAAGAKLTLASAADAAGIARVDAHDQSAAVTIDASAMTNAVTLVGSGYGDILAGGSGSDAIDGGYGGDKLTGGLGADAFFIKSAADSRQMPGNSLALADQITDFSLAQLDTIHLEGLGLASDTITERAQGALVSTSTANFFGGNDIALQFDGNNETRLYGDVNHNGTYDVGIDVMVRLVGNHAHELATNDILIVS
jgi:Ca2+-binding RTX toxin-like protein